MKHLFFFMLMLLPLLTLTAEPAGNSPMFQNGPEHRGVYASAAKGDLKGIEWRFKTGGRIFSAPVVDRNTCFFGSDDGIFRALDAATGKLKWQFKAGGAVDSTAAVADGTVYFLSRDGYVHALHAASGRARWKYKTGQEQKLDEWDFFLSSPCLDRGVLYCGGGDGRLYALDMKSGKERWTFATPAIIHSTPAISGDTVFFGNCEGACYAVSLKTHELVWRFKTDGAGDMPLGQIVGSPSVADGVVYIGSKDHTCYALDAADGLPIWKAKVGAGWVISAPAVKDGIVCYGRTGDFSFHGMDIEKSRTDRKPHYAWHFNAGMYFFSSAAIAGETAYLGSYNGKFFALDLKTGAEKWQFQVEASKEHWNDFYADNRFRYSTFDRFQGKARDGGFDAQGLIDALFTLGSVTASPCVAGNLVYFPSADGCLYALRVE